MKNRFPKTNTKEEDINLIGGAAIPANSMEPQAWPEIIRFCLLIDIARPGIFYRFIIQRHLGVGLVG